MARAERVVALNLIVRSTKAPPPPRFTRQPQKEKMFLAFRISRGWIFSKMERTFFFLGFCPPSIRAVWRGFNMDSAKRKNYFSGEKGFSALPRLLYRPQKGVWGMNAGGICFWIFWRRILFQLKTGTPLLLLKILNKKLCNFVFFYFGTDG